MLKFDRNFINYVAEICIKAGLAIITEYEKKKQKVFLKADKSPVTDADLKSNEIIVRSLYQLDKTIPLLSEESDCSVDLTTKDFFLGGRPLRRNKRVHCENW